MRSTALTQSVAKKAKISHSLLDYNLKGGLEMNQYQIKIKISGYSYNPLFSSENAIINGESEIVEVISHLLKKADLKMYIDGRFVKVESLGAILIRLEEGGGIYAELPGTEETFLTIIKVNLRSSTGAKHQIDEYLMKEKKESA